CAREGGLWLRDYYAMDYW
nr:immunoglobulin heavy chain junction region [Mus musculus]